MRILKEYSALINPDTLTEKNSVALKLLPGCDENALRYIEESTGETDVGRKTQLALKTAASEVLDILVRNAGADEEVRISCSYHKYYFMLVFEFSESALPLHTLNRSVKILSSQSKEQNAQEEIGFMNIVHLVNRIALSVDKISETMRISIIKEKRYPVLNIAAPQADEPTFFKEPFQLSGPEGALPADFSIQLYQKFGAVCDKFLIIPQLFADNLDVGELEAVFLRDANGKCAGGAVWQKTYGITVLMVFTVFAPPESEYYNEAKKLLLEKFEKCAAASETSFIVSKIQHSEIIADYFDSHDEKYNYKSISNKKMCTSYIKPDLIPLLKKAYTSFDLNREIREINYNNRFIEPHSVLTAKIDAEASEAVLSVLWFGDDLKSNIIRHVVALKKIGIEDIYFRLDLGVPEEASISDMVQSCGFEAQYLWPYSSDKGDIVVFHYFGSTVYEMKPCVISPVDKSNIDKVPSLVKKVYGDNYPAQYLYEPKKMWDKIRKRHIHSYIAIDDDQLAAGMIAFVTHSSNPYLFEIGQLMVDPAHRGTNVVNQLIEYIYSTAINRLDFDAILSESVTNHKLSQRSCVNSGFCDTALKLNIMSADAFALEDEKRQIGRMSCVVSCIEHADEAFSVFLPELYADEIRFCFDGLKPRLYETALDTLPETESITEYHINDHEAETSRLIDVTIFHIGSDIEFVIEKLEKYALHRDIKSMLVNIPLGNTHNAAAIRLLKSHGFYFGGVLPYWYPESDAVLMQKLYNNSPDWDTIKLFSRKIKKIAEFIKKDM